MNHQIDREKELLAFVRCYHFLRCII